jgi:hypothetical protein
MKEALWAVCAVARCLFLTFVCSAISLEHKIIAELEKNLPIRRHPSLTSLNGRGVAFAAYRRHAAMFPNTSWAC